MIELDCKDQQLNVHNSDEIISKLGIILPSIMPDELLLGYFGRLGLRNGFPDYEYAKSQVKNIFINTFKRDFQYPLVYQMSDLLSLSVSQIVREHTLIPILRSVNWHGLENEHINLSKSLGYKLAKDNVAFCKECIQEDTKYLGFTYWRRSHQTHGIDLCTKHNVTLHMAKEKNAFYLMPCEVLETSEISQPNFSTEVLENPIIKKYTELIEDYLLMQCSINISSVMKEINTAAHKLNIRRNEEGKRPLISDLIQESVPSQWLHSHFPEFKNKKKYVYLHSIDGVFKSNTHPSSSFSLLLCIAALLPQTDSSILKVDDVVEPVCQNSPKIKIEKNAIIDCYFKYSGDYSEIGRELKLKRKATRHRLTKLNLPALGYLNKETRKAISDFYSGGKLPEILSRYNVNVDKFSRVLRESSTIKNMFNS